MAKRAFDKIMAGAREALAFARGEPNGCVVHLGDTPPMPEDDDRLHKIMQTAGSQKKPRRKRGSGRAALD